MYGLENLHSEKWEPFRIGQKREISLFSLFMPGRNDLSSKLTHTSDVQHILQPTLFNVPPPPLMFIGDTDSYIWV